MELLLPKAKLGAKENQRTPNAQARPKLMTCRTLVQTTFLPSIEEYNQEGTKES